MRDYKLEFENRVGFIKDYLSSAGAKGIVFGNSGGKDSALAGIICKASCDNTLGVILPCGSDRSYGEDAQHAEAFGRAFGIECVTVDLGPAREAVLGGLRAASQIADAAVINIAPRLRMTALYAIAQSRGALVAGTGNRSERHMGYFTKWGDGAFDFNVISDLTVTEIYQFLRFLGAPDFITDKPPSAGLYEGQTDEGDMGVTYSAIDAYLAGYEVTPADREVIERYHSASGHKRRPAVLYNS